MRVVEPIINRHAAWMVVNPIQGCINNCSYCFLQRFNSANAIPKVYMSEEDTINLLLKSEYYTSDIPICLFTSTDIFATNENIKYLQSFLNKYSEKSITNPLVLVTKCKIPDEIINQLCKIPKVVVYISYSGLPSYLEKNINVDYIRTNFMKLDKAGIKIIHYFRPLTPLNSDMETIENVLGFVSKYCNVSVISGLKVREEYRDKLDFWPEVKKDSSASFAECIWPHEVKERVALIAKRYHHYIFETNSCALAYTLGRTDEYGFCGTKWCLENNICPDSQRKKCNKHVKEKKAVTPEHVLKIFNQFDSDKFKNALVTIKDNTLFIKNVSPSNEEICHLSYLLNMQIRSETSVTGYYWGTSINGIGGKNL